MEKKGEIRFPPIPFTMMKILSHSFPLNSVCEVSGEIFGHLRSHICIFSPLDMRRDVQEIFRMTPHEKQVMMFSATLNKEIRGVCKKFMQDVIMHSYFIFLSGLLVDIIFLIKSMVYSFIHFHILHYLTCCIHCCCHLASSCSIIGIQFAE